MTRKTLLASALALALANPAFAADATTTADDDALATLDAVQVSASTTRLPFSEAAMPNTITVIDRAQLEQQLALTRDLSTTESQALAKEQEEAGLRRAMEQEAVGLLMRRLAAIKPR